MKTHPGNCILIRDCYSFWARGYFVSTVGRDAQMIQNYIRHQEEEDARLEQLGLWR